MKYNLPVNYDNLSPAERRAVREQYVTEQQGLCHYCKTPLDVHPEHTKWIYWKQFPKQFLKYPVHLHHCHTTGNTIGAVHAYCNAVLWQYHGE